MAITQQIVRVSNSQLDPCFRKLENLNRLVSFQVTEPEDEIDLNWAPAGMEKYFKVSEQLERVRAALNFALDGEAILNDKYPKGDDDDPVSSNITYLSSVKVTEVVQDFGSIDWARLNTCMPRDKSEAIELLNCDLDRHPDEYYLPEIKKFVNFVEQAANRNMALVQWWD